MAKPISNPTPSSTGQVCAADQCTPRSNALYGKAVLVEDKFGCEKLLDPREKSIVAHYLNQSYYADGSDDFPIFLTNLPSPEGTPARALVQDSSGRVLAYDAAGLDLCITRPLDQTSIIDITGFDPSVPENRQRCMKKWNPGTAYGAGIVPVVYWNETNQRFQIFPLNQTDDGGNPPPVSGPESFEVWDGAATQLLNAFENSSPWFDGTNFYCVNAGEFRIELPALNATADDHRKWMWNDDKIDVKNPGSADVLAAYPGLTLPGSPAVLKRMVIDVSVGLSGNEKTRLIFSKGTDREAVFWADGDTTVGHSHHQQTTFEVGHTNGVITWEPWQNTRGHMHLYVKSLIYGYPNGMHYS